MYTFRSFLLFLALTAACSLSSRAATVSGTVKGPGGDPYMGAFVQAKNQLNNMLYSVLSDKQGHYRIERLPAGSYQIQIRAVGYKAEPQSGVKFASDQNVSFDFALQPGTVRWSDISLISRTEALAGRQRQRRTDVELHGLPRLPERHVINTSHRSRMARSDQLHAQGHVVAIAAIR